MEKALLPSRNPIKALDLFCGAGGSSLGASLAGVTVVAAIDKWPLARKTYADNFPSAVFFRRKAENVSPSEVRGATGGIDMILASPECNNHTCARGSQKKSEASRRTAFEVVRFAKSLKPRWIVVENVIQMRSWTRYPEWLSHLQGLGYHFREQVLNSVDFGVPQSRKRLFVSFDSQQVPPEVATPAGATRKRALDIINPNGTYRFSELRATGRAKATIERAERAIRRVGTSSCFLLVYYGSDGAGGWQLVDAPLRTITTIDRFAYVRPNGDGHEMRMLQVPELKAAMGLTALRLDHGTRRDKIKLIGNGVCPPVMKAIVETIAGTRDSANDVGHNTGMTNLP